MAEDVSLLERCPHFRLLRAVDRISIHNGIRIT